MFCWKCLRGCQWKTKKGSLVLVLVTCFQAGFFSRWSDSIDYLSIHPLVLSCVEITWQSWCFTHFSIGTLLNTSNPSLWISILFPLSCRVQLLPLSSCFQFHSLFLYFMFCVFIWLTSVFQVSSLPSCDYPPHPNVLHLRLIVFPVYINSRFLFVLLCTFVSCLTCQFQVCFLACYWILNCSFALSFLRTWVLIGDLCVIFCLSFMSLSFLFHQSTPPTLSLVSPKSCCIRLLIFTW